MHYLYEMPALEVLEKLSTKRLLTFYRKYRGNRHLGRCGCCGEYLGKHEEREKWVKYLDKIKTMLDNRENVDNKKG